MTIKEYAETVAQLLAQHNQQQTTGKLTITFDLKDGGVGRATATVESALTRRAVEKSEKN